MKKEDWPEYATWWEKNEAKIILFFLFIEGLLILVPILFADFIFENLDWAIVWMGVILLNSIIIPLVMPRSNTR